MVLLFVWVTINTFSVKTFAINSLKPNFALPVFWSLIREFYVIANSEIDFILST